MAFFRFRWLYKLVRSNSRPIPEENAERWKNRLSLGYAFLAWNAFGFVCYKMIQGNTDHGSADEIEETPGQQWARTLKKKNPQVYRMNGLNFVNVEELKELNENKDSAAHSKEELEN